MQITQNGQTKPKLYHTVEQVGLTLHLTAVLTLQKLFVPIFQSSEDHQNHLLPFLAVPQPSLIKWKAVLRSLLEYYNVEESRKKRKSRSEYKGLRVPGGSGRG